MIRDEVLYEIAGMNGVEPDWREEYRRAYDQCRAKQEEIDRLAGQLEDRTASGVAGCAADLSKMTNDNYVNIQVRVYGNGLSDFSVWLGSINKHFEADTLEEALQMATDAIVQPALPAPAAA